MKTFLLYLVMLIAAGNFCSVLAIIYYAVDIPTRMLNNALKTALQGREFDPSAFDYRSKNP
jgi:hypothetical protein